MGILDKKTQLENFTLVYPNPANTIVNIDSRKKEILNYQIIDLYGKTVKQAEVNNSKFAISVSNLPAGIYVLKLNVKSGFITKRIVVQ